jgi:hypothetical protein
MECAQDWPGLSSEEYFSKFVNESEIGEQASSLTVAPMRYDSCSDLEHIATGSQETDIALEG